MTWFEELTGVEERSPDQVRRELLIEGNQLVRPDGKRIAFGRLDKPMLAEFRQEVAALNDSPRRSIISEIVADVQSLHTDPTNANAMF